MLPQAWELLKGAQNKVDVDDERGEKQLTINNVLPLVLNAEAKVMSLGTSLSLVLGSTLARCGSGSRHMEL